MSSKNFCTGPSGHADPDNSGLCIYCALILDSFEDAVAAIPRYFITDDGTLEETKDERLGNVMKSDDVLRVFDAYNR